MHGRGALLILLLCAGASRAAPAAEPRPPGATAGASDLPGLVLVVAPQEGEGRELVAQGLADELLELGGLQPLLPSGSPGRLADPVCPARLTCLAEAARLAGARLVLRARLDDMGLHLLLVDARRGAAVDEVLEPWPAAREQRLASLHEAVLRLLAPEAHSGRLDVAIRESGVGVALDGRVLGTTPLEAASLRVRAGVHTLRITEAGRPPLHELIEVRYGEVATLALADGERRVRVTTEVCEAPELAQLLVWTRETDVALRLDGAPVPPSASLLEAVAVPAGVRRLTARKPGHEPAVLELDVQARHRYRVRVYTVGRVLHLAVDPPVPLVQRDEVMEVDDTALARIGAQVQDTLARTEARATERLNMELWRGVHVKGGRALKIGAVNLVMFGARNMKTVYAEDPEASRAVATRRIWQRAGLTRVDLEPDPLDTVSWAAVGAGTAALVLLSGLYAWESHAEDFDAGPPRQAMAITGLRLSLRPGARSVALRGRW